MRSSRTVIVVAVALSASALSAGPAAQSSSVPSTAPAQAHTSADPEARFHVMRLVTLAGGQSKIAVDPRARIHPRSLHPWVSADVDLVLHKLRWTNWGKATATATGRLRYCEAAGTGGPICQQAVRTIASSARLVASGRRTACAFAGSPRSIYTRLLVHVPGSLRVSIDVASLRAYEASSTLCY